MNGAATVLAVSGAEILARQRKREGRRWRFLSVFAGLIFCSLILDVATGPSLLRIADAVRVARLSRRLVKQNLAWSAGYNLLAVPLAAAGMVTPWIAALGMAVSSLVVTLNALRLARTSTEMAA